MNVMKRISGFFLFNTRISGPCKDITFNRFDRARSGQCGTPMWSYILSSLVQLVPCRLGSSIILPHLSINSLESNSIMSPIMP